MGKTIFDTGTHFTQGVPVYAAQVLGLEKATVYMTIKALCGGEYAKRLDGYNWVSMSMEDWMRYYFKFASLRTLNTIFSDLEKIGLLVSCQPEGAVSRRKWYRIGEGAEHKFTMESFGFDKEIEARAKKNTSELVEGLRAKGQDVPAAFAESILQNLQNTDSARIAESSIKTFTKDNTSYGKPEPEKEKAPSAEDGIFSLSVDETELETEAEPESKSELENLSQHASDKPKQGMENLPQTQPFPAMGLEGMTQAPRSDSKPKPESFPSQPPKTPEKARRNQLLEHLAGIDGSTLDKITPAGWKVAAKALKEIKAVEGDALTTDMLTRAENAYRKRFPDCRCTPLALAKHWGALVAPQSKTVTASPYRLVTQEDIDSGAFPDQSRPF